MSVQNEEKLGLPLGFKIIWFLQIFGFVSSLSVVFSKKTLIIVGPWVLTEIFSNLYIATILVSQAYIVYGLPKFQKRAWFLLIFTQLISVSLLFSHLFIPLELFNKFINVASKAELTLSAYQSFIIPAMLLQSLVLMYVVKKRAIFDQ